MFGRNRNGFRSEDQQQQPRSFWRNRSRTQNFSEHYGRQENPSYNPYSHSNQEYSPYDSGEQEFDHERSLDYGQGEGYGTGSSSSWHAAYPQVPQFRQDYQYPNQGQWQHQDFRNNESEDRGFGRRFRRHRSEETYRGQRSEPAYGERYWNRHGEEYGGSFEPSRNEEARHMGTDYSNQHPNMPYSEDEMYRRPAPMGTQGLGTGNWGRDMSSREYGIGSQGEAFRGYHSGSMSRPWPYEEETHAGKGPKGYKRSEERIKEDVHEALTQDPHIDATNIEVSLEGDNTVVLKGTVDSRYTKRHAEEIIEHVTGVQDIRNELKVESGTKSNRPSQSTSGTSFSSDKSPKGRSQAEKSDKSTSDRLI